MTSLDEHHIADEYDDALDGADGMDFDYQPEDAEEEAALSASQYASEEYAPYASDAAAPGAHDAHSPIAAGPYHAESHSSSASTPRSVASPPQPSETSPYAHTSPYAAAAATVVHQSASAPHHYAASTQYPQPHEQQQHQRDHEMAALRYQMHQQQLQINRFQQYPPPFGGQPSSAPRFAHPPGMQTSAPLAYGYEGSSIPNGHFAAHPPSNAAARPLDASYGSAPSPSAAASGAPSATVCFCESCGRRASPTAVFCSGCGIRIVR
jgi:hypothetical protein